MNKRKRDRLNGSVNAKRNNRICALRCVQLDRYESNEEEVQLESLDL